METRLRAWARLPYLDPEHILRGLRQIATEYPLHDLPYKVSSLRQRDLRAFGEGRQAALFCFAMSQFVGAPVWFAHVEASDYDVIARYIRDNVAHYVPIQLKEFVPQRVKEAADLQDEIDKIEKYTDSSDLVVAFHLNRDITVHPSDLRLPSNISGLWLYGALAADQARWIVIGNLLSPGWRALEFAYPGA